MCHGRYRQEFSWSNACFILIDVFFWNAGPWWASTSIGASWLEGSVFRKACFKQQHNRYIFDSCIFQQKLGEQSPFWSHLCCYTKLVVNRQDIDGRRSWASLWGCGIQFTPKRSLSMKPFARFLQGPRTWNCRKSGICQTKTSILFW